MRFYRISWQDLMKMPVRAFWMLSGKVGRLRAEENLDVMELHLLANPGASGEMIDAFREKMNERMGNTAVFKEIEAPEQHAKGIAELQQLGL